MRIKKLELYLARLEVDDDQKLEIMINKLNAETYGYTEDAKHKKRQWISSMQLTKKPNVLYAGYKLNTTRQSLRGSIQ